MIYWRLAGAITFASFAVIVCAASVACALTASAIAPRVSARPPASRAAGLFALRVLPWGAGLFGAFGIVLPMFLWFEPSDTQESLATTLAVVGAMGALWLARGAWRAVLAWRATRALARDWRLRGRRLDKRDVPVPVFAIDETYPMVAVVGVRRPALFISDRVLRACSPDEVRAMILHECAHVAARDNIKRFVLRACPNLFANRRLDTLWAHATEEAADAAAAGSRPGLRTDLARALVTVARLATLAHRHRPLPASALYLGGSIESRVRRLLGPAEPHTSSRVHILAASIAVIATITAAIAFGRPLHDAIEAIVTFLP